MSPLWFLISFSKEDREHLISGADMCAVVENKLRKAHLILSSETWQFMSAHSNYSYKSYYHIERDNPDLQPPLLIYPDDMHSTGFCLKGP